MVLTTTLDVSPLFTPLQVGSISLSNRFIMPGMQRGLGVGGIPTPAMAEYYSRRVKGGVGLIITESTAIDHSSASRQPRCVHLNRESLDGWRRCVDAVRAAGGNILIQLWHEGAHRREGGEGPFSEGPTLSPSGLVSPTQGYGRAATREELGELRDAYVHSALLAQEIGASGVEIHGAHGYLLDQFLWSATNLREDEYGGPSIADRMRFPCDIVRAVRDATSRDFVISFRFSQWKEVDFDATIVDSPEELQILAEGLVEAGVDMINVSTRRFHQPAWDHSPLTLAGWVKKFSTVPVATVGSIGVDTDVMHTLLGGEATLQVEKDISRLVRLFEDGEFDLAAVGRSLIGDPDWVLKVQSGRYADVRPFTRSDIVGDVVWEQDFVEEAHGASEEVDK